MLRRSPRRALVGASLWLALSAVAFAGGEHYFEMLEDLDGLRECYLGDYSTLYDFTPYAAASKNYVSDEELAALRASWAAEKERVAQEIAHIEQDPEALVRFRARRRVAKNSFFRDVDYRWMEVAPPLQFVVQDPQKAHDGYHERAVGFYEPWARGLLEVFREEYVEPLGLAPRDGAEVYTLAILNSEGAYLNYNKRMLTAYSPVVRAHYDPRLRTAITYEPSSGGLQARDDRQHALIHELVHELQHAFTPDPEDLPHQPWLNEGLAEYLSSGTSSKVEELATHPLDAKAKKQITDLLGVPGMRDAYFLPVRELVRCETYRDVQLQAYKRGRGVGFSADMALDHFYREAYLFVYFLHEGEGAKYRAPLFRYLAAYFRGEGTAEAFEQEFGEVELDLLERDFVDWLRPGMRDWAPRAYVEPTVAGATPPPPPPAYDPAGVRPHLDDAEACLALAVYQASVGRASEALAQLDDLDVTALDAATSARVGVEKERIGRWVDVRRRYLEFLLANGKKLELTVDGKRKRYELASIERGVVRLAGQPEGEDELAVTDIAALDLVKQMGATKKEFDPGRVRLYMSILCGDERWKKLLDKEDPEDQALRDAAETEYPRWLADGRVLARLLEVAQLPEPKDATAARAVMAAIDALVADSGKHRAVLAARAGLADLYQAAAVVALRAGGVAELFSGAAEDLGEGRVRVRWDFADAAQLDDFQRGAYPYDGVFVADDANRAFTLVPHGLDALGGGCLRTLASFQGAFEASYSFTILQFSSGMGLLLGAHDDGAGNRVLAVGPAMLVWVDESHAPGFGSVVDARALTVDPESALRVALQLEADGTCTLAMNGEERVRLADGMRREGHAYLSVDSEGKLHLSEFSLTGTLAPASRDELVLRRAAKLAAKLRD
ncbi:MAG: hypothetical protein H6828_01960 [Planctomycetes bacterium]|nr:hypothetical protein [Planctomycetota bacterium]